MLLALALCGCSTIERRHDSANQAASPETDTAQEQQSLAEKKRLSVNLHVFGLSYHPDRNGTRVSHLDNEFNAGLGLGYKLHENERGEVNSEIGFYKDSGRTWAKFAGVNYLFKMSDRWRLGADLLAIQSPSYNMGDAFIAPVPRLSYDFGRVKLNLVYVPKYKQVNAYSVYALYFTIPLWK